MSFGDSPLETEKNRLRQQLRLYQELNAPVLLYAETTDTVQNQIDRPVADRPIMPDEEFKRYGEKLTALAEWLAAEGCPMTYHHHMGTVVETEREIDLLMANTDTSVGLLLDVGHLTFAAGDVLATTRRHGTRINHVHCKDIRAEVLARLKTERWSFLKGVIEGVFTVPGDGSIDFFPVAKVLAEIGYRGLGRGRGRAGPEEGQPTRDGRDRPPSVERGLHRRRVRDRARLDPVRGPGGLRGDLAADAPPLCQSPPRKLLP